jgi:hypothetical protein
MPDKRSSLTCLLLIAPPLFGMDASLEVGAATIGTFLRV